MQPAPTLRSRASGILLHPSSLPGPVGIGDLGAPAVRFAQALAEAKQTWWQMLPIGPTGFGNSPYAALSSFAGNPLLISLERLVEEGWLNGADTSAPAAWPADRVPFAEVEAFKTERLRRAFATFERGASGSDKDKFEGFRRTTGWLATWSLYRALKDAHQGAEWVNWEPGVRGREAGPLEAAKTRLAAEIRYHDFVQYAFARQWHDLHVRCRELGIGLIGDIPFYVPHDSAEVWAHQDQFDLGRRGRPMRVAGVPPDDFAKDGQLWGFPLYNWESMRATDYAWWLARFRTTLAHFDAVRIDHFIGFHRAWAVPGRLKNALHGRWIQGPDGAVFERLKRESGSLELIAEDLGVVTPEVEKLRDGFDLPGIRVLQFGFGWDPAQTHLPHKYPKRSLAATGTHDNDTSRGWYEAIDHPGTKDWVHRYLKTDGKDIAWVMIQAVLQSPADTAIVPAQDLLNLGSEARMNRPGVATGNWGWRMLPGALTPEILRRLGMLTQESRRARA
ncbi:MAG TPA: 4-alpha-glucanotransferase [Planctomycetota bacterium]|nr:4-alpha-glucanotransferase [Planctomycetota bacterium]